MSQSRRTFLQTLSSGAAILSAYPLVAGCDRHFSGEDPLWQGFQSPPSLARPFFRWWWNGNRITADDLLKQLNIMYEGGAGGIEINPIGLHDNISPTGRPVDWLSDEWNNIVRTVADEAGELDMYTDLIVGTGWPFGGEFLAPEETIQGVTIKRFDIEGPTTFVVDGLPVDVPDRKILSAQLFPAPLLETPGVLDITSRIAADGSLTIPVTQGRWVLYLIEWHNRFRDVLYGAPGADGPVLDHFNRLAVEKYLDRMSDRLGPAMGGTMGNRLRSLFCDSIELEGANWTTDLPEVFEQRRGYPIWAYLPLILDREAELDGLGADTIRRARFDFSQTLAELFSERFIVPYHEWCNRNGVESRYQAYGHPWLYTDLLDGNLIPDIPEGDQWLFSAGWVPHAAIDEIRYAIWNKYASSGAHFQGRRIASSEAMTNTRGVFEASLEYVKQATDLNLVAGINHLVLHGYNHSPGETEFPGWLRFGTYFHPSNPWWTYFREWSDYAARLCWIFQETRPTAQIGILGPTADVWSDHGLDRNPYNQTPWYLHTLWQACSNLGYGAEYVNRTILSGGAIENGRLTYGPCELDILILVGIESIDPGTAESLAKFVSQGGRVAVVEKWPSRSPQLSDADAKDVRVLTAMEVLRAGKNVVYFDAPEEYEQLPWMQSLLESFNIPSPVVFDNPDDHLFQIHAQDGDRDIFFLANVDRQQRYESAATFNARSAKCWKWEADTGERQQVLTISADGRMDIDLAPLQSVLFVFDDNAKAAMGASTPVSNRFEKANPGVPLEGTWNLKLEWPDGRVEERQLDKLTNLCQEPGLEAFSGWATYRIRFDANGEDPMWLDLGEVHETAEVSLNGKPLPAIWYGPRRFSIAEHILQGSNLLEIRVGTLLFNYVRSLTDNENAQFFIQRSQTKQPIPTGLVGPVRIG